jgi:hypothetical protein
VWRPPSELGALEIEVATRGDGADSGAIAPESAIVFRPVRR